MSGTPRKYPVWLSGPDQGANLRMVNPGLYVGNEYAVLRGWPAPGEEWCSVLDLYGTALSRPERYRNAKEVVSLPMHDGNEIPESTLDMAWEMYRACRGKPFLVHCQAGYSRSVSVAYALLRRHRGFDHERALRRVKTFDSTEYVPRAKTLASARAWAERHLERS